MRQGKARPDYSGVRGMSNAAAGLLTGDVHQIANDRLPFLIHHDFLFALRDMGLNG